MKTAVVTIVSGRHAHLRAQRQTLTGAGRHVVVAMDDPAVPALLDDGTGLPTTVLDVASTDGQLPLAAARNAGAEAALADGAQLLVFLDVDCLAGVDLLARYRAAARDGVLLCGPVTYLRSGASELLRDPHPARPDPPPGEVVAGEHELFWSLSFAVTAATWRRVGGFHPGYTGYGAEDTDFALQARSAGVGLAWVGGADAFHQYHPSARPPVQHVPSILRNGATFAARWGWWPMGGWLAELAELGVVRRAGSGWAPGRPVRLASIPAEHPYLDAIRAPTAVPAVPGRVEGWDPDPLLDPAELTRRAGEIDVVHVHFGYEHLDEAQMAAWVRRVRELRLALVVTVHDLRNPHHRNRTRHDEHLRLLLGAADEVLTLTPGAANEIAARFSRRPTVVAHPSLLDDVPAGPTEPGLATVHFKSLRASVGHPERTTEAVAAAVAAAGGRLRVDVHPNAVHRPELAFLRERTDVVIHERFTDAELAGYLRRAHVSVLPYRTGTHSGWLELCRDLGTRVVAPDCGYFAEQWDGVISYRHDEQAGLDDASLTKAVAAALAEPPPAPADRAERAVHREQVRAVHAGVYHRLTHRLTR